MISSRVNKNDTTYKVIKLSNGEDIIATLTSENEADIEIENPLLMSVFPQMTKNGELDSLNLSRWIQPYTEQSYFTLSKSTVVTTAVASPGLSRYYEYVLKRIEDWQHNNKETLEDITDDDVYEDLLEELETESKSIH
tara:strand:- start:956 stop:1369 length:414 start_codon:yes stop_codon:yes gene_type:complete